MMTAGFKAACIQMTAARDLEPNIESAGTLIRAAHDEGARFVATPENTSYIEPDSARAVAKALPEEGHPALAAFTALADELDIWLLIGSLSIRAENGKIANRSFLIDPAGTVRTTYDKLHLFDVSLRDGEWYRESDTVRPGGAAVTADLPWGVLGMTVCYDLRFPQLYRALAHAGAAFLSVPSAFTRTTGRAHWHTLLRARAIETGCYVLAPAQCGVHAEGRKTYGHALIVDPWGEVLADAGEAPGFAMAEIDPARVAEARRMIPSLEHDRPFDLPTGARTRSAAE